MHKLGIETGADLKARDLELTRTAKLRFGSGTSEFASIDQNCGSSISNHARRAPLGLVCHHDRRRELNTIPNPLGLPLGRIPGQVFRVKPINSVCLGVN